jgi:hypothetical protein
MSLLKEIKFIFVIFFFYLVGMKVGRGTRKKIKKKRRFSYLGE